MSARCAGAFGNGNEAPLFAVRGSKVLSRRQIGKGGTHLKVELEVEDDIAMDSGGIRVMAEKIHPGQHVSVAFVLEEDTYAGGGACKW